MANEKRLIDADAKFIEQYAVKRLIDGNALEKFFLDESKRLREQMEDEQCTIKEKNYIRAFMPTVEWARKIVRHQTTVDAVEVVHAQWVQVICYEEFEDGVVERVKECCSACHAPNGRRTSYFCPNCGALMDGERNDDGK